MLKSKLNSVQLTSKLGSSASDQTDCPQLERSRPIQTPKYKYFHILHHKQRTEGFISFPFCPSVRVNVKFEENLDRLRMWAGRTVQQCSIDYTKIWICWVSAITFVFWFSIFFEVFLLSVVERGILGIRGMCRPFSLIMPLQDHISSNILQHRNFNGTIQRFKKF